MLSSLTIVDRPKHPRRRGWTVIELMASLALASLLVTAILGVTADLGRELASVKRSAPQETWATLFERQLGREYEAARAVRVTRDAFVLDGYLLDLAGGGGAAHGPSQIEYRIEQIGGRRYFVRIERRIGQCADTAERRNIVAAGVRAFELKTRLDTDVPPGNLRLAIWATEQDDKPIIDVVLVRHGVPQ